MDQDSARQRSRKGCLTCRQRRKKCDEVRPICGRCKDEGNCNWPAFPIPKKKSSGPPRTFTRPSRLPRTRPPPSPDSKLANSATSLIDSTAISASDDHQLISDLLEPNSSVPGSALNTFTTQGDSLALGPEAFLDTSNADALGEDESVPFKVAGWLPSALRLLSLYLPLDLPYHDGVLWSSVINSYFSFHVRYCYQPIRLPAFIGGLVMRNSQVESVRLGILGMSVLFHSYLDPELPRAPLQKYAIELVEAASASFQTEITQPYTTLDTLLSGLSAFSGFYYYLGDPGYVRYLEQALPIVQRLIGTAPVDIGKLRGPEKMSIRLFAECDVFTSIAAARPLRLAYDCNVDELLCKNQQGPDSGDNTSGSEWMYGFPTALLLLTMQIVNLKHATLLPPEHATQAAKIETSIRDWKIWPTCGTNSVASVQRVAAQEIWRHFVILYLYHAIYKATPSDTIVQKSVQQMVKLASTLQSGHNPDCLLYIPYFVAGTFAVSIKHRRFFRNRLMNCGLTPHGRMFANALVELWQKSPMDRHVDWSSRTPPLVMF